MDETLMKQMGSVYGHMKAVTGFLNEVKSCTWDYSQSLPKEEAEEFHEVMGAFYNLSVAGIHLKIAMSYMEKAMREAEDRN